MKANNYGGNRHLEPDRNGREVQSYTTDGYSIYTDSKFESGLPERHTLQDYLGVVKERSWWLIFTFSAVFIAVLLYTHWTDPLFRSAASVEVMRETPDAIGLKSVQDTTVQNLIDVNTQIERLKSETVIAAVQKRIQADPKLFTEFMQPYEGHSSGFLRGPLLPAEILRDNRTVLPIRQSRMIVITYTHPSPEIAAKAANLFAEEFTNHNLKLSIKDLMKAVDDLKERADQQRMKVEALEMKLADYRQEHNQVTIDPRDDIDREELTSLRTIVTEDKKRLDEAAAHWHIVQEYQKEKRNLWDISRIASIPQVQSLLNERSTNKIHVAALGERYREKHPKMILAREALKQTETELAAALQSAFQKAHSGHLEAKDNYRRSREKLTQKEQAIIDLSKVRIQYNSILRELKVNQSLYQFLIERMQQHTTQVNIANSNIRIVDRATPSLYPHSPNIAFNLLVGSLSGLVLGMGLIFLIDLLDNRIKSVLDIEKMLAIPLLGVIPRITKKDLRKNAYAVAPNVDPRLIEAFRSTYSSLKLSNDGHNAKTILVTSTLPNEGKSLVAANLAATYASHGERVLLLDCDLRASQLAHFLKLQNDRGIIQYCQNARSRRFFNKAVFPGVDLIGTGGVTENASTILSSERFKKLLNSVKKDYDKILIDTPPTNVVSDAFHLLRLVDGIIYVIRFNTVNRTMAKLNVSRLKETRTPILGAILNNITVTASEHYYPFYGGSKLYHQYYFPANTTKKGANRQTTVTKKSESLKYTG